MNVARSTFVRRGYLVTALALAVLLAASAGTAWAQTIRFSTSRATLDEGASSDPATRAPLKVSITRSGDFRVDTTPTDNTDALTNLTAWDGSSNPHVTIKVVEYDGSTSPPTIPFQISARSGDAATTAPLALTTAGVSVGFGRDATRTDELATTIELTIENANSSGSTPDNGDWNVETLVLELEASSDLTTHLGSHLPTPKKASYGTRELAVTVTDDDPMPKLTFAPPSIQLARGNMLPMTVRVGVGAGGRAPLPDDIRTTLNGLATMGEDDILLTVSPPEAVGSIIKIYMGSTEPATGTDLKIDSQGRYIVGTIGVDANAGAANGAVATVANAMTEDGIKLNVKAIDVSGFRDEQITFTIMEGRTDEQKMADGGAIDESDPSTVTILSGEDTPTVTFSTDSISIDEGASETVHLLADTDQGSKVGSATVSVRGDALLSLRQNGSAISGGVVEFGGSANAVLEVMAASDPDLEDGEESTATVTITSASGANIGDPRELTVTVVGSTAVPVLPLVGQLLLALLLTAGGARLYRRRQG